MKINLILILCTLFLVASCGDDAPTSPLGSGFSIPLAVGNYWLYDTDELDSEGKSRDMHNDLFNFYLISEIDFLGRKGFVIKDYNEYGIGFKYISSDVSGIYFYFKQLESSLEIRPENWYKTISFTENSWVVFDMKIDTTINESKFFGFSKMTGETTSKGQIEFNGELVNTITSRVLWDLNLQRKSELYGDLDSRSIDTIDYLLIDKLGIYSMRSSYSNGSNLSILKDYKIE